MLRRLRHTMLLWFARDPFGRQMFAGHLQRLSFLLPFSRFACLARH
jgi:hypothetical protein